MENVTIAWIILSIPIVVTGCALYYNPKKKDVGVSIAASIVTFGLPWWGLYFLIIAI